MSASTMSAKSFFPVAKTQRDLVIDAFIIARETRETVLPETVSDPHRRAVVQDELQELTRMEVHFRSSSGDFTISGPTAIVRELAGSVLVGAAQDISELADTLAQTMGELTDEALTDLRNARDQVVLAVEPFIESRQDNEDETPESA